MRTSNKTSKKYRIVTTEEIKKNNYDLCPPFYLSGHSYPKGVELRKISDLFYINKGQGAASEALDEGKYPFITSSLNPRRSDYASFSGEAICIPTVSATGHGHAAIKTIHYVNEKFEAASITAVLTPKNDSFSVSTIYYYLLAHKDDLLVPLMRGATNKSMNIDRLADLLVPVLSETSSEYKIVKELLDLRKEIDSAKSKVNELIATHDIKIKELGILNG